MTVPATLPAAADLIAAVKATGAAALEAYAPAIDELANAGTLAAWLGIARTTVYQEQSRMTAGGMPRWPAPDCTEARLWRYRTIILHRAAMPGLGSAGRGRPARHRYTLHVTDGLPPYIDLNEDAPVVTSNRSKQPKEQQR